MSCNQYLSGVTMLRIAVIGIGFIGNEHLEVWSKMKNIKIAAICGRNEERAALLSNLYHCSYYTSSDTLFKKDSFDIVDICTPTFLHEQDILLAVQHKTHVICEKPITLSLESMGRILDAVKSSGIKLMVGQVLRFWSEYNLIKKIYDSGKLGKILSVYAHRLAQYPPDSAWRHTPSQSGGGFFDLHIHDIDYAISLFGEVESVYSAGVKSENDCWDNVSTILKFKNGIFATTEAVLGITKGYPFSASFRIVGTDKTLDYTFRGGINIETMKNDARSIVLYDQKNPPIEMFASGLTAFQAELNYFASCVEKDIPVDRISPYEVYYVLKVMLAIQESLNSGRLVTID